MSGSRLCRYGAPMSLAVVSSAPAATLRMVVEDPGLRLRSWVPERDLDRPVDWVHMSELADPAAFLEGGELLLTTGLSLPADPVGQREYVARLVSARIAGLGFGTGLTHDEVPAALVAAAQELDLPLFEVPLDTPFIALSKIVSRAIAAARYHEAVRLSEAQRALTRAALRHDGFATLVGRLAVLLGGWVMLTDAAGTAVEVSPAAARTLLPSLQADLDRLRHQRPPASLSSTDADGDVVLQSLGTSQVRGLLVVGKRGGLAPSERQVINTAASLLTLGLEQSRTIDSVREQLRTVLVRLFLAGQGEPAKRAARALFGALPVQPVHVLTANGSTTFIRSAIKLMEGRMDSPVLYAEVDGALVVITADPDRVADQLSELPGVDAVGVSEAGPYAGLAELRAHAAHAGRAAQRGGAAVLRFADLAGEGLLRLVPPGAAAAFASALLAPVLQHDAEGRGDLAPSLHAWLESNGQWDPAAARLGVHRHTLRKRMVRVEGLLGRSLDSVDLRCELWLALQVLNDDPRVRRDADPTAGRLAP